MAAQTTSAQLLAIREVLTQMRDQLQLLVAALPPGQAPRKVGKRGQRQ